METPTPYFARIGTMNRDGAVVGSRPGCLRGRLARDESWGETPLRQAGRLPHYRAVHGEPPFGFFPHALGP